MLKRVVFGLLLVCSISAAHADVYFNFAAGASTGTVDGTKTDAPSASIATGYQWDSGWYTEFRAADLGTLNKHGVAFSTIGPVNRTTVLDADNATTSYSIGLGRTMKFTSNWSANVLLGVHAYQVKDTAESTVTDFDTGTSSSTTTTTGTSSATRDTAGLYSAGLRYSPPSNKNSTVQLDAAKYSGVDRSNFTVSVNMRF